MAKPMKTPGVYIVEKNAFANSLVEVETAVPAFIGYTQKAVYKGSPLLNKPKQISSLSEFHEFFGFAPHPMFTMSSEGAGPASSGSTNTNNSGNTGSGGSAQGGVGDAGGGGDGNTAVATEEKLDILVMPSVDALPTVARVTVNQSSYTFEQTAGLQLLYYSLQLFFQNGGGKCFIVSVGSYEDDISKDALLGGLQPLVKEQVPTMVVVPDAVRLEEDACKDVQQAMLSHCVKMANRMAIVDVWEGWRDIGDGVVDNFRNNIGTNGLKYGAAYYPWLETSVVSDRDLGVEHIENKEDLASVLAPELGGGEETINQLKSVSFSAAQLHDLDANQRDKLDTLNDTVRAQSVVYKHIIGELRDKLNLLPPSAAMAGIYTRVDNQRGVWKAPVNVSVSMVNSPAVSISHDEQESLNVTPQGKSINAIREFVGEGVLVWGARTLDGNSLDWRYINVRRTLIMLEESTRLAAKAFVFEPNTANTWITMKSMITNFLTGIWKRGGLAGASPEEAFSVHVGLGETMTPEDILEGIMRITVLVAPSHPAEFIEITFQQHAQKS